MDNQGRLALSVEDAAHLLGVNRSHLYPRVMSGEIPSFKIGARRLISVAALEAWVAAQGHG